MADYLKHWLFETIQARIDKNYRELDYSSSSQYRIRNVHVGDVIWVVTSQRGIRKLLLCGPIRIGKICGLEEAQRLLGKPPIPLRKQSPYVLAYPNPTEKLKLIDLTSIAHKLRFLTLQGNDRLEIVNGTIDADSLIAMRLLTTSSSTMMREVWKSNKQD